MAPTVQQVRTRHWLERHLPADVRIHLQDVTSAYTALNLIGPNSRPLMQDLTGESMRNVDFPAFQCRVTDF